MYCRWNRNRAVMHFHTIILHWFYRSIKFTMSASVLDYIYNYYEIRYLLVGKKRWWISSNPFNNNSTYSHAVCLEVLSTSMAGKRESISSNKNNKRSINTIHVARKQDHNMIINTLGNKVHDYTMHLAPAVKTYNCT